MTVDIEFYDGERQGSTMYSVRVNAVDLRCRPGSGIYACSRLSMPCARAAQLLTASSPPKVLDQRRSHSGRTSIYLSTRARCVFEQK